jgi:hypothetical protein
MAHARHSELNYDVTDKHCLIQFRGPHPTKTALGEATSSVSQPEKNGKVGQPANEIQMSEDTIRNQFTNGLRRAGIWLFGFLWLGLVFAGMAIAFTPSAHSPVLGWGLLTIAGVVLTCTMDRWVKVFPGLLAYGVLGAILMLVNGHAVNHPEVSVTRVKAVILIIAFAAAAGISFTFTKHNLTPPDRIALFTFVVCFFWQAVAPRLMSNIAGCCIVLARRSMGI